MTEKEFFLKLSEQALHVQGKIRVKKLIFNLFIFTLAVYAASSVPVSVILDDEPVVGERNVTHVITAYEAVDNVTIIDYFSDVEVPGIGLEKEEFLGKEWISVKIPAGGMKKGEIKTVTYDISRGEGEAMLGADVYYIEGERHQRFPEKMTIDVKPAAKAKYPEINNESVSKSVSESINEKPEKVSQNYPLYILFLASVIILFIVISRLKKNKK